MTVSTDITAAYRLACNMEDDVRALRLHTRVRTQCSTGPYRRDSAACS